MYTLIPQENIKHLTYEYRLRFVTALFIFLSFAVWVGIVSLFPSYIVSVTEEGYATRQAEAIKTSPTSKTSTALNHQIGGINAITGSIFRSQDSFSFSNVIEGITKHRVPGISITSFEVARTSMADGSSSITTVIRGQAVTREALSTFKKALELDPKTLKVDWPVSNLAQSKNINFYITDISI